MEHCSPKSYLKNIPTSFPASFFHGQSHRTHTYRSGAPHALAHWITFESGKTLLFEVSTNRKYILIYINVCIQLNFFYSRARTAESGCKDEKKEMDGMSRGAEWEILAAYRDKLYGADFTQYRWHAGKLLFVLRMCILHAYEF